MKLSECEVGVPYFCHCTTCDEWTIIVKRAMRIPGYFSFHSLCAHDGSLEDLQKIAPVLFPAEVMDEIATLKAVKPASGGG